ncbi:hypothetical protein F2P44_25285 [Massilia sp. CCM 8695]|uniref:Uncharacterized protein n=1 Tax=Massilia frigida TaxID=2609281 RepID=A0ABX0NH87_9BURK|nr:hypothetical protein [Massilia frigida]NHZ82566.1 hypothetical protein [Massilia frigida]
MSPLHASRLGHYVTTVAFDGTVKTSVPPPLPPVPALELSARLVQKLSKADRAIGRLRPAGPVKPARRLCVTGELRLS